VPRVLKNGETAFYFVISKILSQTRAARSPIEPLGTGLRGRMRQGWQKVAALRSLNALFDEWEAKKNGEPIDNRKLARLRHDRLAVQALQDRGGPIPRRSPSARVPITERIMQMICDTLDKKGRRIGDHMVREVTPPRRDQDLSQDHQRRGLASGCARERRLVGLCRKVWNVMRPPLSRCISAPDQ